MTFDLSVIIGEFQAEAGEHIEAMNARLLELERNPAATAAIRAMFLSAHTIKGSAAMLDLQGVNMLAHAVEDVLAYLRDEHQPLNRATADVLFKSLDMLRAMIDTPAPNDAKHDPAIFELCVALRRHASGETPNEAGAAAAADMPRALLIDDSATVRQLETMQLQEAGFQVDAVADGRKALELAMAHPYDVIVTGVVCEKLGGWDLVAALHEVPSSRATPIVVISSDRESDAIDVDGAGLYAYLRKGSLHDHDLHDTARRLLAEREQPGARKGRV